jgi:hypothetical protein
MYKLVAYLLISVFAWTFVVHALPSGHSHEPLQASQTASPLGDASSHHLHFQGLPSSPIDLSLFDSRIIIDCSTPDPATRALPSPFHPPSTLA